MFKLLNRRLTLRVAIVAGATTAMLLGISGTANAATGTINTAGAALTVRASPGTGYDAWSSVNDGATVNILCQTEGSQVTCTYGTTTIWDMLSNGGFVSDAYVNTGSDGYVEHRCVYTSNPPRANPRGANAAISWAFANLGTTAYENR